MYETVLSDPEPGKNPYRLVPKKNQNINDFILSKKYKSISWVTVELWSPLLSSLMQKPYLRSSGYCWIRICHLETRRSAIAWVCISQNIYMVRSRKREQRN